MTCLETIQAYAFRSIGYGERILPREDFTLCQQFTLIGSGMLWNIYFGVLALLCGFFFATGLALAKASPRVWLRAPSNAFIFVFRGSPLFIQFFLAYFIFLSMKQQDIGPEWLTSAWAGALIVLFFNTAAYSAQIFYGALQAIPRGDIEAADAYGFAGSKRFRRIVWPTMLRLSWPAYTNEAIFLFQSTTLAFASSFPVWQQRGDALYYARNFARLTFNPFIAYPILAGYFIIMVLAIIGLFGIINRRLNRHLPGDAPRRPRLLAQIMR